MARLSINDLNNLSGVSDKELESLYKEFRRAHTKVFNDIQGWVDTFDVSAPDLHKKEALGYHEDIVVYNIARKMYYDGTLVLDSADLFDEYARKYHNLLNTLKKSKEISEVMKLTQVLMVKKKEIIDRLSECYGLYSEAYDRLEEEDYEW